jgi:DNA-binding phage protein
MVDTDRLNKLMDASGLKRRYIAEQAEMTRQSLHNKTQGKTEWKASEIVSVCRTLNINDKLRDEIFLSQKVTK